MAAADDNGHAHAGGGTETKASFKTTELIFYVLVLLGILIASNAISSGDGQTDWFRADQAWLYITMLTVGYMIARGLAKSGSRDPAPSGGGHGGVGLTERLEAAVGALKDPAGSDGHRTVQDETSSRPVARRAP